VEQGHEITIHIEGPDEKEAFEEIKEMVDSGLGEEG